MNKVRLFLMLGALVALFSFSPALRADLFDDAERAATKYLDDAKKIKELLPDEVRKLVKAICEADDEERKSISSDITSRVKDSANYEYDKLKRQQEESNNLLEKVLADEKFKDKHSKAREFKDKVKAAGETAEKLTSSVRGANHPVVSYMLEAGERAHKEYQGNSSNCTVYEWELPGGLKVDCIKASSCELIEIKPNNSRAKSKGRDQLSKYARLLNEDPKEQQRLIDKYPDFKSCFENGEN